MNLCKIDTVLDVGANIGQTGKLLRDLHYKGRIISFEPLSDAFRVLESKCRKDPQWTCHQWAFGEKAGTAEIHVSAASDYSSFLPTTDFVQSMDKGSIPSRNETVQVRRLDETWPELQLDGANVMLKIDTQGFERNVLEGASGILSKVSVVQLEMSIRPIYVGQPEFVEMIQYMRSHGYVVSGMHPGGNSASGELLEFDGIFMRPVGSTALARGL